MQLRTITCDVAGCSNQYTESVDGAGFPGWGQVSGLRNPETGATEAHLCPVHLLAVAEILKGAG